MNLTDFTAQLELRDGIYYSTRQDQISYPSEGNSVFYDIEANSFWFKHRNNIIGEVVKRYSKGNFFFDIGGGNGFVAKAIEDRGFTTILVEPGADGCQNAKKRGLKHIICATLENCNFEKGTLPNIGLFDVVEHIENDDSFLKAIHSFLSPEGFVFVTVPAYNALWSNEDVDAGHYRRYTVKSIEKALIKAGFQPRYSTYMFSLLPLPIFLQRSLPSRIGLNKDSNNPTKHQAEHSAKKGLLDNVMNWIWKKELETVASGRKIRTGSSCLIVAQKI